MSNNTNNRRSHGDSESESVVPGSHDEGMTRTTPVHISVVLDRSGSMASIADDIVGGFNTFLDEQRRVAGSARVTLAQFDTEDPFEVLIDGEDLATVAGLDPSRFLPRGGTPLFDAVGKMIARVDSEIFSRADAGLPIEDQLVMIITDGQENSSVEFGGRMIQDLIETRRNRAWAFVFLGSDEAAFAEGARIGVAGGSTARWEKTGSGTREMLSRLSAETAAYRTMGRRERSLKAESFLDEEE